MGVLRRYCLKKQQFTFWSIMPMILFFFVMSSAKTPANLTLLKHRLLIVGERRKTMDDQNVNSTVVTPAQGTTAPAAAAPVEGKKHKKNKKAM
jgi:hypothetical protein